MTDIFTALQELFRNKPCLKKKCNFHPIYIFCYKTLSNFFIMICYVLLTEIWLTASDSGTVRIYTQTIHRTTQ